MDAIVSKYNMSLLEAALDKIPPQGRMHSEIDNEKIKDLIITIQECGLDYIVNERIDKVGEDELDDHIEDFKQAFYSIVQYLKKHGFVDVHGYQVRQKTNI